MISTRTPLPAVNDTLRVRALSRVGVGVLLVLGLALTMTSMQLARGEGSRDRHDHWAFRRLLPTAVPMPADRSWVRGPVDAFVRRGLEESGLEPAPPARRLALLRRVHFDLVGLPPIPEEVLRFLRDDPARAAARARLLTFGRPITASEAEHALEFLEARAGALGERASEPSPREAALAALCLALFNANEFVYID